MSRFRLAYVVALAAVLVTTCALASGRADGSGPRVKDGTYLGYVRKPAGTGSMVTLDLVPHRAEEILVDAGPLARVDLFTERPQPFRMVIEDGTIVQVTAADDVLGG